MKKLLLVAVSVGVFLLITITAAIVIMTSKVNAEEAAIASSFSSGRVQPVAEGIRETPVKPEVKQEINITPVIEEPAAASDKNDGERLIINIPKPSAAAVSDPVQVVPAAPKKVTVTAPVRVTANPQTASPQAAKPAAQSAVTQRPAPAVNRAPTIKTINDYWVQTGAFSAQIRAEDAKETLALKGITSIIENRQVDGRTWYRVRLGPYTSEKEANYWLALVKTIDGFSESQVRQTVRQQ
ncbi:MAG: SPOR domain-containing protein [Treponema sp.]|nr:SPOR domain-containing protein [Treponema sp.]